MKNRNKILLVAAFAALFSMPDRASAQYQPVGDDGISASPKLRQHLNERTVNMALATRAGEPDSIASSTKNTALLASPRYLEEHPELLRTPLSREKASTLQPDRLATLTENTALARSPRFREEHPELRWTMPSAEQSSAQNVVVSDRLDKLTENKALAASPRFKEEHPELLRSEALFEIAPLK